MPKSSYTVKQGDLFGRLGSGIGHGANDYLSKELERNRISEGLNKLGEQKDLSPFQRFAGLAGIAPDRPQLIQSGSELLKQESQNQAFKDIYGDQQKFEPPTNIPQNASRGEGSATTEKRSVYEQVLEGFNPPSAKQRESEATQEFTQNPGRFKNDFSNALEWVDKKYDLEEKNYNNALKQHGIFTKMQDSIKDRLDKQKDLLKATNIDADAYKNIQNEAIRAVLPKSEGGEGLTEQQAINKYGDELKKLDREAKALDTISDSNILFSNPKEVTRSLDAAQQSAKDRLKENPIALQTLAEKLIADKGLSAMNAYAKAMPVRDQPEINKIIKDIPNTFKTYVSPEEYDGIIQKLAPLVGSNNGSILSIGYELEKKGLDPSKWIDYMSKNRKGLNISDINSQELLQKTPWLRTLNDWWLSSFTGVE